MQLKMSLRKKTLLMMGTAFAALIVILIIVSDIFVLEGFLTLESKEAKINVQRSINEISNLMAQMDSIAGDWARWDDTYKFIQKDNPEYIDDNLNVATIKNLGINFMLFFDTSGRLFDGMYLDLSTEKQAPEPVGLLKGIFLMPSLIRHENTDSRKTGIVVDDINMTPAVVASQPILKSDSSGPIQGTLIVGKYLDAKELGRLSDMLHLSLEIQPVGGKNMPEEDRKTMTLLLDETPVLVKPEGEETIVGYTYFKNFQGNPAFLLKIKSPRNIYHHGLTTFNYYTSSIIGIGLCFIILVMLFLEKAVLSPLKNMSANVNHIGRTGEFSATTPVLRKDELGVLSDEINSVLNTKKIELSELNQALQHEVDERKQAEKIQLKLETDLRQAQKMESIGTLAGGIAHDFNNILTSVIGYTELSLSEVENGSPLESNLQEVYIASQRAKDLVKQILTFARQAEEVRKPIRVSPIARETLKLLRSSIPTTIEIKQAIESDSLIMGNPTQIQQIFMNLCTNAAQAMNGSGGVLDVRVSDVCLETPLPVSQGNPESNRYLKIIVSDTGIGIPPDSIQSIFEPYFSTKEIGSGTGLGLAVVHGIVKNFGGDISVKSIPGKGSEFTVYLPITGECETPTYIESDKPSVGNERVLLVDDELTVMKVVSRILEQLGYAVTARTNSMEALALFRTEPDTFDLVITDMTMPNMTGDSLAIELMKIRSDIPVILCTGYSDKICDERISQIGIKAFASKPIAMADLAKIVRKVLDEAKKTVLNSEFLSYQAG